MSTESWDHIEGRHRDALDRVQIMNHDWFLLDQKGEMYRYTEGNFGTFPGACDDRFYIHHSLEALSVDAIPVLVEKDQEEFWW